MKQRYKTQHPCDLLGLKRVNFLTGSHPVYYNTPELREYDGIELGELVKITSGKRHGWYKSNVGLVRKPL